MTGATPAYGLPYPTASDRLDAAVTTIPQSLATQIESTLQGWGGIAAPGAWVSIGAAGAPAFGAGFGNFGGGFSAVQYRKVGSQLFIRGLIVTNTAQAADAAMFTLPVGFRPLASQLFTTQRAAGLLRLDVTAAGKVSCPATALNAADFVSLFLPPIWID